VRISLDEAIEIMHASIVATSEMRPFARLVHQHGNDLACEQEATLIDR
jgi:hypothetical protein